MPTVTWIAVSSDEILCRIAAVLCIAFIHLNQQELNRMKQSSLLTAFKLQKGTLPWTGKSWRRQTQLAGPFVFCHQLTRIGAAAPKKSSDSTPVAKVEVATNSKSAGKSSPPSSKQEQTAPPKSTDTGSLPTATINPQDPKPRPEIGQYLRVYWADDDDWCEPIC